MRDYRLYRATDKMSELICDNYEMLQVLSRFGISLGFGDQTVGEVCQANEVDCTTFLIVVNFLNCEPAMWSSRMSDGISAKALISYLRQAHSYYLGFELPSIKKKLIEAIDFTGREEVSYLIIQFFDAYVDEVRKHMEYEEQTVFPYTEGLLFGKASQDYSISIFEKSHEQMNIKLKELKNIIIKYYPAKRGNELMNATLFDIFNCEKDLDLHKRVEDFLFIPLIKELEKKAKSVEGLAEKEDSDKGDKDNALSAREKEILSYLVRGYSHKEIGDKLNISIYTVITHRRNLIKKLQIHSLSGLTIYAIVNGLVELSEINTNI